MLLLLLQCSVPCTLVHFAPCIYPPNLIEYRLIGADEAPFDHLLSAPRVQEGVTHVEQLAVIGHVRVVPVHPALVITHTKHHSSLIISSPHSWSHPRCSFGWCPHQRPGPGSSAVNRKSEINSFSTDQTEWRRSTLFILSIPQKPFTNHNFKEK